MTGEQLSTYNTAIMAVTCPQCGVGPLTRCRAAYGQVSSRPANPHDARVTVAEKHLWTLETPVTQVKVIPGEARTSLIKRGGCATMADVQSHSWLDLMEYRRVGFKSVAAIIYALEIMGSELTPEPKWDWRHPEVCEVGRGIGKAGKTWCTGATPCARKQIDNELVKLRATYSTQAAA